MTTILFISNPVRNKFVKLSIAEELLNFLMNTALFFKHTYTVISDDVVKINKLFKLKDHPYN